MTNFIYSTSIDWMLLKPLTVLDDAVVTKTNENLQGNHSLGRGRERPEAGDTEKVWTTQWGLEMGLEEGIS